MDEKRKFNGNIWDKRVTKLPRSSNNNKGVILPHFPSATVANNSRLFYTPETYNRTVYKTDNFHGACIETGATRSICRIKQAKAYCGIVTTLI